MPRWRTKGQDTGLSTTTNANQNERIRRIITEWDATSVEAAKQGGTVYGCGCGSKKSKATGGDCCEWGSLRIDRQRTFTLGKKSNAASFNAYNIQYGTGSYAAVNIQTTVTFTLQEIRTAFTRSIDNRTRVWLGNASGKNLCFSERDVEDDN